jgi:regulator of sigma E protease
MMSWLTGGVGLIFGFSWLIFVHELGHYLLAKWNGVRVHVFSLGMGPYILSWRKGETLYVLSLVPIGGYVKMAGQDDLKPNQEATKDPHDYRNKRPGQRAMILAAGAIFNLIFAYLGFAFCYRVGVKMEGPVVGEVFPETPLAKAMEYDANGVLQPAPLQRGDRITMVGGQPVKSQLEITLAVASSGSNRDIPVQYERNGRPARQPAIVHTQKDSTLGAAAIGFRPYSKEEEFQLGFECEQAVYIFETLPNTPAAQAGFQRWDKIVRVDGRDIEDRSDVQDCVKAAGGREQVFEVERDGKTEALRVAAARETKDKPFQIGISMISNRVKRIDPACEAYEEGLRQGGYILDLEKERDEKTLALGFVEVVDGKKQVGHRIEVPVESRSKSGFVFKTEIQQLEKIQYDTWGEACAVAWGDLWTHSISVFVVIYRLCTGDVSVRAMAGPLGIGDMITRVAVQKPLMFYFWLLALLSLNLGVLQFIPIPLLDGFHLVMVAVEKLKGRPVSMRVQEAFQYAGLVLIIALLLFVTWNDIARRISM